MTCKALARKNPLAVVRVVAQAIGVAIICAGVAVGDLVYYSLSCARQVEGPTE